jgi:membrane protease YdiL (CAAX protease family)
MKSLTMFVRRNLAAIILIVLSLIGAPIPIPGSDQLLYGLYSAEPYFRIAIFLFGLSLIKLNPGQA